MRHLIVGALLVLAALAVTSVTAQLLEQAAMNRQSTDSPTAIVEGPALPSGKATGKSGHSSELARQVILVARRLASGSKD
jgi:hypothetical protein